MVIEMNTMNIFPVLGFVVNNHTKGLLGIISNIEQSDSLFRDHVTDSITLICLLIASVVSGK